jgi:energy-coupling factor transporter ATP-binding protein EcfA2
MLHKLEIDALRGATNPFALTFEKGKKITILYGENGSGKSTICDALEFLGKGNVGSLDNRGLGKTGSFWHSTGRRPDELSVTLSTSAGQWVGRVVKSKVAVKPDALHPRTEILRKNQILALITGQPKNRYDAISPFIDIASVEQCEAVLRKLLDHETNSRDTASARIEENRVAVENFWKEAGMPPPNALDWARIESAKDTSALEAEIENLETFVNAMTRLVGQKASLAQRSNEVVPLEATYEARAKSVEQEEERLSEGSSELVGILEAAKTYFHDHREIEACPLCESAEYAATLPSKVDEKLQSVRSLAEAIRLRSQAQKKLEFAREQTTRETRAFLQSAVDFSMHVKANQLPKNVVVPADLIDSADALAANEGELTNRSALADELSRSVEQFLGTSKEVIEKRKAEKGFLQTLKRAVETYDTNFDAHKDLDVLIPRLEQALQEMEKERREFVDEILGKIAARVGELYEEIHEGEGLSKITLLLDPKRRASLDILATFPGTKNAPPGAYFSDSHLDSLGLCIFLALAEMGDAANTILVLDDVVASADEPHCERIIELLYTVAENFEHCIFTTHYRPWKEKYRWGWLRNGQCHFEELLTWQHGAGIKLGKSLPPILELRNLLAAPQPSAQLACASAGVILERILDFLTYLYRCKVPRDTRLTLGDLLPSVNRELRKSLRIERLEKREDGSANYTEHPLGALLDELQKIAQARNIFGAHFSELAQHLPEADALHFAGTVLTLADHIIDLDFGWPRSDKSGSYWSNSKQTRRLHPLKQPA